jgi:peptidoglycan hydrolase-like protein with peptidoglycan-binding domain
LKVGHAILIRVALVLCALLMVPGSWAKTHHRTKASAKSSAHSKTTVHQKSEAHSKAVRRTKYTKHSSRSRRSRGQQSISENRAREIQEALIREHYLQGDPSGSFDAQTKAALTKYQHDNGWQTKVVPDSRALIKLGLGPSHDGLLNPESAAIGNPHELGVQRAIQTQADAHK